MTLDRYGHLWPDDLDALAELAERLDQAHAAAITPDLSPQRRPEVVQIRKEQVSDLLQSWRWGDSNSRPAMSSQGFSERSHRSDLGPRPSGSTTPRSQPTKVSRRRRWAPRRR
jgi:hypothetical protein